MPKGNITGGRQDIPQDKTVSTPDHARRPPSPGNLVVNDDGHAFLYSNDDLHAADLRRYLRSYCRKGVGTVAYCVGDMSWPTLYPTRVGVHYSTLSAGDDFTRSRMYKNVDNFASEPRGYFGATFEILRELGKKVLASFRMNDAHFTSVQNPHASEFWKQHAKLALGPAYGYYGGCLDYASDVVRAHFFDRVVEFAELYPEIDGIELDAMRSPFFFLPGKGPEHAPLFTELVRRIKAALAAQARRLNRPDYLLSTNVPLTPELALECGLDVAAWDAEGLFDYVSVGSYWTDMDHPIKRWKKLLVHGTPVFAYIGCSPQTGQYLGLEEYRAAAANAHASGADGVYLFNYPCLFELAFQMPIASEEVKMTLPDMRAYGQPDFTRVGQALDEIGQAESLRGKDKRFLFFFIKDARYRHYGPSLPGLDRQGGQASLKAVFPCYEDYDRTRTMTLRFKVENVARTEQFQVSLNGHPLEPSRLQVRYAAHGRDSRIHTVTLGPYLEYEVSLLPNELCKGENVLEVTPTRLSPDLATKINLVEIELLFSGSIGAPLGTVLGQWATATADALLPLDLRKVKVGGEIGRRINVTVNNNLLVLDAEKDFLAPFRAKTVPHGYLGLGKLIDATVRFAAYTDNEKVIALKKHLVEETIKTQERDGYIGMMAAPARMWSMFDVHEMGYIIFGLTSNYHFFGEKQSLEAARRVADYILDRWSTMPSDWEQQTRDSTHMLVTGLERSLITLHRETGDDRYLAFCVRQRALPEWDLGIVTGRREGNYGHVYAYLASCLAQLELYRLQPEKGLLRQTERAMQFMTAQDGVTITGAVGEWESWMDDQGGGKGLGETCATAYQLRFYDSLLRLEGSSRYGDLMERIIYNTLFGAQSPDGRQIRYYTPLGGNRNYWPYDTYCCPGNFRRIVSELPTMIYYRSGAGLAINLYTPSEATLDLDGGVSLKVRQETDYPTSGRVVIQLDPSKPAKFPLRLRIPRWGKEVAVTVNGQPWREPISLGDFLTVERQWRAGDEVTLDMPMSWRLVIGRKRQSGRTAIMRGPVVFCLNPSKNESLQKQDAVDLDIMIDANSLKDSPGAAAVRPGDTACQVTAGDDLEVKGVSGNLSLRLTEFPDPEGKVTYFRLPDLSAAAPDELLSGGSDNP